MINLEFNTPTNYRYECERTEDNVAQLIDFVAQVYANFPTIGEEYKNKVLRKEGMMFSMITCPPSKEECVQFKACLKQKISELIEEGTYIKLSTDYFPEGTLLEACKTTFKDQRALGHYFPYKTCTWIKLNKEKVTLDMNFIGPKL